MDYSDKGSRFFDHDKDLNNAQTGDRERFSPSLMHLEVGEVDLTHILVPAVSVHSHAPSNDLSKLHGTCGGCLISTFFREVEE